MAGEIGRRLTASARQIEHPEEDRADDEEVQERFAQKFGMRLIFRQCGLLPRLLGLAASAFANWAKAQEEDADDARQGPVPGPSPLQPVK